MACPEGRDGARPVFRERLLPPWWLWGVAAVFVVSVGIAYDYALGLFAGVGASLLLGAGLAAVLWSTAATVSVDECVVRAGRARLPLRFVAQVEVLDKAAAARARTLEYDPRAYLLLRTWTTGSAVRIILADDRDPHPFWLVTVRDPEAFAEAISSARESARQPGEPLPKQAG